MLLATLPARMATLPTSLRLALDVVDGDRLNGAPSIIAHQRFFSGQQRDEIGQGVFFRPHGLLDHAARNLKVQEAKDSFNL